MAKVWGIYNPKEDGMLCIPLDYDKTRPDTEWIWAEPKRLSSFNNCRLVAFASPDENLVIESFKDSKGLQQYSPEDWYLTPIEVDVESGRIICYYHDEAVKFL